MNAREAGIDRVIAVMADDDIIAEARRVIAAEALAIAGLTARIDDRFVTAARMLAGCTGRVVTAAVGKSGFIARKLASTLSSLGTPAFFVHPTEGVHGDLGMLKDGDVIVAISHSGNSDELLSFLVAAKLRTASPVVALAGNGHGAVGEIAAIVLETGVTEEACALGLAPTTSSTAALALADALAVSVSRVRGFRADEFAMLHPAGALGDRLRTPVEDMMRRDYPWVEGTVALHRVIEPMTRGGIGLVLVFDHENGRIGIITDGDIRRAARPDARDLDRLAREVMSTPPRAVPLGALGVDALMEMERERVTALAVMDGGTPVGIVHIHDILRYGLGITREPSKVGRVRPR